MLKSKTIRQFFGKINIFYTENLNHSYIISISKLINLCQLAYQKGIADCAAGEWLKYPENKPVENRQYLVKISFDGMIYKNTFVFESDWRNVTHFAYIKD